MDLKSFMKISIWLKWVSNISWLVMNSSQKISTFRVILISTRFYRQGKKSSKSSFGIMFIILVHCASWRYPTTKVDVPQLPEQKGGFHTRTACPNVTCTLSNLTCFFPYYFKLLSYGQYTRQNSKV